MSKKERLVTLIDGSQVSTNSEEWRHECEARSVCRMPGKLARRNYLAKVQEIRGLDERRALEKTIRKVWEAEFLKQPAESEA